MGRTEAAYCSQTPIIYINSRRPRLAWHAGRRSTRPLVVHPGNLREVAIAAAWSLPLSGLHTFNLKKEKSNEESTGLPIAHDRVQSAVCLKQLVD